MSMDVVDIVIDRNVTRNIQIISLSNRTLCTYYIIIGSVYK